MSGELIRTTAALVCAVGATLLLPAAASAAVLHVDDDASAPRNPCTDPAPARACTSISDAVEQARLLSGAPHTIQVAPGLYVEEVALEEPDDAGLRIEGSGAGADPATQTIVEHGDDDGFNDGALDVDTLASGVVVRDLRVTVPPGANFLNDPAIEVNGPDASFERVRVVVREPSAGTALFLDGASPLVRRVVATAATPSSNALFVASAADGAVIRDSRADNSAGRAATVSAVDARIERSVFSAPDTVDNLFVDSGSLTLVSSLITGGRTGLDVFAGTATVRHTTVDAGDPKVADPDDDGLTARADNGTARIRIFDSIVLERQELRQGGDKVILCTRSDVPHQVETAGQGTGSIRCPATPGNARGNQTSAVGALFVGRAADWHLRRASPAVDRGTAAVPAGALDLDRNSRIADGNGDGVAATDMGAFELPALSQRPAARVE